MKKTPQFKSKKHPPLKEHRIQGGVQTPFVARCGKLLMYVTDTEWFSPEVGLFRGVIIEGRYINDHCDRGPGETVTIGPISDHWRRLSIR